MHLTIEDKEKKMHVKLVSFPKGGPFQTYIKNIELFKCVFKLYIANEKYIVRITEI